MNGKNMNNKHWQKSMTKKTTANYCGTFAFIRLVDPKIGISTICLLFFLFNIYGVIPIK